MTAIVLIQLLISIFGIEAVNYHARPMQIFDHKMKKASLSGNYKIAFPNELKLIQPSFDSALTDLIIDLDHLRKKQLGGTTNPRLFFQLKHIFHMLESIGSARIEGNKTTIAEYIETKLADQNDNVPIGVKEIRNIEAAMTFIEENVNVYPINRAFISELHKLVVNELSPPPEGEGDHTPGLYRQVNVQITKSSHVPPDYTTVESYMDELLRFIQNEDSSKYDLIKVAIAHHRFVWIHPFRNGNGRTVRLLTYAMLVKAKFNVDKGRIINPTAVFCANRDDYYKYLSEADRGSDDDIENWCTYVLSGLKTEIEKIDKFLDYKYLRDEILFPTLSFSLDRKHITESEYKILKRTVEKQTIQAKDIKEFFKGKHGSEVSRQISRLIEKRMLVPIKEGKRTYAIRFDNNYLLRGIINSLGEKGFIPNNHNGEKGEG